jgi:hypothetical protein
MASPVKHFLALTRKQSQNVASAARSLPELNPAFLDGCLQAYFSHFNIYFPILHRPTFVYRDCSPSLILNAIALGSLFIGTNDAVHGVSSHSSDNTTIS